MLSQLRDPNPEKPYSKKKDLRPKTYTPIRITDAIEQYHSKLLSDSHQLCVLNIISLAKKVLTKPYSDLTLRSIMKDLLKLENDDLNRFLVNTPAYRSLLTSREWYSFCLDAGVRMQIAKDMELVRQISAPSLVSLACNYNDQHLAGHIAQSPQIIAMLSAYDINNLQKKFPFHNKNLAHSLQAAAVSITHPERKKIWLELVQPIFDSIYPIVPVHDHQFLQRKPLYFGSVLHNRAKRLPRDLTNKFQQFQTKKKSDVDNQCLDDLCQAIDAYLLTKPSFRETQAIVAKLLLENEASFDWCVLYVDSYRDHLTSTELTIIGSRNPAFRENMLLNPHWVRELGANIVCAWGITDNQPRVIDKLLDTYFEQLSYKDLSNIIDYEENKEAVIANKLCSLSFGLSSPSSRRARLTLSLLLKDYDGVGQYLVEEPSRLIQAAQWNITSLNTWLETQAQLPNLSPEESLELLRIHPAIAKNKSFHQSLAHVAGDDLNAAKSIIASSPYFQGHTLFDLAKMLAQHSSPNYPLATYCAKLLISELHKHDYELQITQSVGLFLAMVYAKQADFKRTCHWLKFTLKSGHSQETVNVIGMLCQQKFFDDIQNELLQNLIASTNQSQLTAAAELHIIDKLCALSLEDTTPAQTAALIDSYRKDVTLTTHYDLTRQDLEGGNCRLRSQTEDDLASHRTELCQRWERYHSGEQSDIGLKEEVQALADDLKRLTLFGF